MSDINDIDSEGEMSKAEGVNRESIDMNPIKSLTEQDVRGLIGKLASQAQFLKGENMQDTSPYAKERQDLARGRFQQLEEILGMLGQEKAVTQISIDYKI